MTMRYCWSSEKSMEDVIASLQQQGISYDKQRNRVMVEFARTGEWKKYYFYGRLVQRNGHVQLQGAFRLNPVINQIAFIVSIGLAVLLLVDLYPVEMADAIVVFLFLLFFAVGNLVLYCMTISAHSLDCDFYQTREAFLRQLSCCMKRIK